MALPKWLWDPDLFPAGWAWGWRLRHRQRKEALKLADAGRKHPDEHVAAVVGSTATTGVVKATLKTKK